VPRNLEMARSEAGKQIQFGFGERAKSRREVG